jgi:hypothetical protein
MVQALPAEKMGAALASITQWRLDPDAPVACPVCGAPGLSIIDQSARPFAEWYALSCKGCGLEANVHIPLGPPV